MAAAVSLLLLAPAACSHDATAHPVSSATAPPPASPLPVPAGGPAERAAAVVAALTDEELAGQVLMPYAYGNSATDVTPQSAAKNRELGGVATPAEMVARYHLGALILVSFSAEQDDPTASNQVTRNVENPKQVRALTDGLQKAAASTRSGAAPLLIGTDQEFGVVTRVTDGVTLLPAAMAFGAAGKPEHTEAAWKAAGEELAAMGVNIDFAPVADTLGPQQNPAIGSRSYGGNAGANAVQVGAAVKGLRAGGVAASLKHFPGHGHTGADSHKDLPLVTQSRSALDSDDLPPFAAGIGAGAELVMSGHLDVTALDPGVPATFSKKVMTDLLRGQLTFTGVAVTDAMNMTPAMVWPAGEAAVKALNAGNDLLLMPPHVGAAHAGIVAGVRDGILPKARLVEAATRVLTLRFTLAGRAAPDLGTLATAGHQAAVRPAAAASITLLRGSCKGKLITGPVTVTAASDRNTAKSNLVKALQAAGVTVVDSGGAVVHLVGYNDKPADLRPGSAVTVAMDTPYLLAQSDSKVLLATYSSSPVSMAALADVLAGKTKAAGKSPVDVPGLPRTTC